MTRLLILSVSAGNGHVRAAQALEATARALPDAPEVAHLDAMDCVALAEQAGTVKAVNLVLMGRLSHYFDISDEAWDKAIQACVPAKFLELNRKAFALGKGE